LDERRFPRSIQSLNEVFTFIADFLRRHGLDAGHSFDLDLLAEELFTNTVKYGTGNGAIALGLDLEPGAIVLQLRDFGAEPYDVTRPRPLPADGPLAERKPGGLGLHLVQRIADRLDYDHDGHVSTITVRKRLSA
jgi:serine/threonine-protein kinase RsbW